MATDRFTKSPASRKRMSELISRIGKDESQDAGDLLTDEALEDLPESAMAARPGAGIRSMPATTAATAPSYSSAMAFADEPTIREVPEGVEYRTEDSAGGAARPLGEIGGYGRVDEEAFSKMLDEAEPLSFEDEKKLVAQQVAAPENYGTWEGGGGYTYTHVTDDPDNPYIVVEKEGKPARRVVPGTKGIGGSDMYGRILAEKTLLDVSPEQAKAFYKSLPKEQRDAIEAAGNVDVSGEDIEFGAIDPEKDIKKVVGEAPKTSEAGEPLPKPAEDKKAEEDGAVKIGERELTEREAAAARSLGSMLPTATSPLETGARLAAEAAKYGIDLLNPSKEDAPVVAALKGAAAGGFESAKFALEEAGAPPGLIDEVASLERPKPLQRAPESGEEDFPVRRADFAADEAKRPFESGARMDTNRPPADAGPTRVSVEREPGQYTFANPPEEKSGRAKAEPRRGTATAPAEYLEFYQGIGEAADITPAGGDPRVPDPRVPTVEGQLTPEDLLLAADITPPPAGTAMVEPRRGDLDTSSDLDRALADTGTARQLYREAGAGAETGYREGSVAASPSGTKGSYGFEATAQDFMAAVGPLSREAPPSVKAAGDEAVEFFVLGRYVLNNGGSPEDMQLAQYFAEKGDSNGLLAVLDNLPANVAARMGGA